MQNEKDENIDILDVIAAFVLAIIFIFFII
jgi:hypothetical protein